MPHTLPLHVAVPVGSHHPRRRGLRAHVQELRGRRLDGARPARHQRLADLARPRGRPARDELVAVGDALHRAGHLDAHLLTDRLDRATGARGIVRARRCAPALTPLAASRPESLIRWWVVDSDLPDLEAQVLVLGGRGRVVAHGDLGYRRWKVLAEYEGRQHAERRSSAVTSTATRSWPPAGGSCCASPTGT